MEVLQSYINRTSMWVPGSNSFLPFLSGQFFPCFTFVQRTEVVSEVKDVSPESPSLPPLTQTPKLEQQLVISKEDLEEIPRGGAKNPWTQQDDRLLLNCINKLKMTWEEIGLKFPQRTVQMCQLRYKKLRLDPNQPWRKRDDEKLLKLVARYGERWDKIAEEFNERTAKQIKYRYNNQLRPDVLRAEWTLEEDVRLIEYLNREGKDWDRAKELFPGRTTNQIKNRYYLKLRKLNQSKLQKEQEQKGQEN